MKDAPKSQSFGLASLAERKMAELRSSGHHNIVVIGGENGIIRIKSTDPGEEIVITEVSLRSLDSWLREYFARRNSISRDIRNLNRDLAAYIDQNRLGNGATFGPIKASALLYLNRFAARYPEKGEVEPEEPSAIDEFDNCGNGGVNKYSALQIVAALAKEVD